MANEWNVSYPLNHTLISDVPGEIRKLKDSCKDQFKHEHEDPVDGDATGAEHSAGSAVVYEGTDAPTDRPGGATLGDNAIDRGRLYLDDDYDPPILKRWDGSAWEIIGWTAIYAGGESVTFPNGLIMKVGYIERVAGTTTPVTFDVAFPNALVSVVITQNADSPTNYGTRVGSESVTGFSCYINAADNPDGFYWMAFGR